MGSTSLAVASLIGSGIQAGALVMFLLGVCPTLRRLPVPEWLGVHESLDRSIERFMPLLNLFTGGTALALLFFAQDDATRTLRITALCCNIGLALISELVSVPINKRVKKAHADRGAAAAGDLARLRERWITAHWWRTGVTCAGFGMFTLAFSGLLA
jgi:uncharacterized membrane protein